MSLDNDHAHVDFPKLARGGVDGAFFALYIPASLDSAAASSHIESALKTGLILVYFCDCNRINT